MTLRPVVIAIIVVSALLATPGGAAASCVQQGDAELQARAGVIVDGVILAGAKPGKARLRVSRYLKGNGPRELILVGGSSAGAVSSIDVALSAGERWRIFGALSEPGTVVTSVCDGSARIDELGP